MYFADDRYFDANTALTTGLDTASKIITIHQIY